MSCGSNAGMETTVALVNMVSNTLFHSNSHISQTFPQIIRILRFCLVDLLPPDFVINCMRSGLFNGQISGSSYGCLTLLHFRT